MSVCVLEEARQDEAGNTPLRFVLSLSFSISLSLPLFISDFLEEARQEEHLVIWFPEVRREMSLSLMEGNPFRTAEFLN
ncbi:hypothetical protein DY000_02028687 [Brassica cretica]|uniref:Uncharacterized protein n=1 Tax=Brassica cretica TaxID=69181 RepID=A0ABQ7DQP9_BRACR|nr:hypothetical protein DY000_02028687 [Brassica cretica]